MKRNCNIFLMNLLVILAIMLPACTKEQQPREIKAAQNYGDPFYQERIVLPGRQSKRFAKKKNDIELIDNRHVNLEK